MSTTIKAYKDEVMTLAVEANATGLTDLGIEITFPDSTNTTLSTAEVGSTKVYTYDFTSSQLGTHVLKIVSPTDTTIDGKPRIVTVQELSREDLGGASYDPSVHSLEALSGKVDVLVANASVTGGHL